MDDLVKHLASKRSSLALLLAGLTLAACSGQPRWTAEEIDNAQHLLQAQQADVVAELMLSTASPHGDLTADTRAAILEHRREALRHAQLVRDDVLEKLLPGLSGQFRETFGRGLELLIQGAESGDRDMEAEGARLHQEWIDWSHEHGTEIQIPAQGVEV